MLWNDHSRLDGSHALLSPSQSSWLYYEDEKSFFKKYVSSHAQILGTTLHEYAEKRINYRMKLRKQDDNDVLFYLLDHGIPRNIIDMDRIYLNLMNYVNDGIGYRMDTEIILYYSNNVFGTADAIKITKNEIRIHDYKSGVTPAHMEQLEIYDALACLEYKLDPSKYEHNLSLYQSGEIISSNPEPDVIKMTMEKIVHFDKLINDFKEN